MGKRRRNTNEGVRVFTAARYALRERTEEEIIKLEVKIEQRKTKSKGEGKNDRFEGGKDDGQYK